MFDQGLVLQFSELTERTKVKSFSVGQRGPSIAGNRVRSTSSWLIMASIRRQIIYTPKAPVRQGIYSQAVIVDRTMYISGQLGMDVASGKLVDGGVQAQAKQALINIGEILKAAGCDYSNGEKLSFSSYVSHVLKFKHELSEHINPFISVVKTTVLLADINDFNNVNEVYKTFFSSNFPARAAYQVAALPRGGLVEIEAIAVLGPLSDS
uniref:2-iminobutanoate/2-iminopropanoate deaminase n=1 Tax=Astatotilapia calliptera TaxID=8154 RepID=A0AAX7VBM6_ASTCA